MIDFLIKFCGIDSTFLDSARKNQKIYYQFISLFILITITSFISVFIFINDVMENLLYAFLIALFFSQVIFNYLRLIFSTINKSDYLGEYKESLLKRLRPHYLKFFMLFIFAVTISKPLEVKIFDSQISPFLDKFKENTIIDYERLLSSVSEDKINTILEEYEKDKEFNIIIGEEHKTIKYEYIEKEIQSIEAEDEEKIIIFESLISKSNFFVQKIKILSSNILLSWLVTLTFIFIFYLPFLIVLVNDDFSKYFHFKNQLNKKIILSEYELFKKLQKELFFNAVERELIIQKKYRDPPFNTLPIKNEIKYFKKGSLIEWLKNNN